MKMSTRSIMCLLVLGVTLVFGLLGLHLTPTFLNWSGDILIHTVGGVSRSADPRVVLLLIDEDSLAYGQKLGLGRWPWPRSIYAEILDFINRSAPPKAVFFDILFSESDPVPANDTAFAEAIARSGNVVHNMLFASNPERKNELPLPQDVAANFSINVSNAQSASFTWNRANQYTLPLEILRSVEAQTPIALGLAMADFAPDTDGVYRRGRMLFAWGKETNRRYFPSLSSRPSWPSPGPQASQSKEAPSGQAGIASRLTATGGRWSTTFQPPSRPGA